MTTRMTALVLCVALLLPALAWAAAAEDDQTELDVILRANDARGTRTKIVSEDFLFVEGKYRNVTVKVPSHQVVDVLRADRPQEYDRGLERYKERQYTVAAKYFTDVLVNKDQKDKPWVIEYCNFRVGEAMYDGKYWPGYQGKKYLYDPPAKYYEKVIKANPKSRFLLDASVKMAISQAEMDQFDEAEKSFVAATAAIRQYREETARTAELEYRTLAAHADALLVVGRARLLEKKSDLLQATDAYVKGQRMAKKLPDIYVQATDGELRCLMKQNKFGEARARAETLIKSYQDSNDPLLARVLPGAYTIIGFACVAMATDYEARSNTVQALQAYADARWNYLQVLVQFSERDEYLEEANFFVGFCYDRLKENEPIGKAMAIRYWLTAKRDYPNGTFGQRAAQELARVGYKEPAKPEAPKPPGPVKKPEAAKG